MLRIHDFQKLFASWPLRSLATTFLCLWAGASAALADPLKDAAAVWHFRGAESADADAKRLSVSGAAKVGVALDEKGAAQSRRRGGDGVAARLEGGGFLTASAGKENRFRVEGRELTLLVRAALPETVTNVSLVSQHGGDRLLFNLYVRTVDGKTVIGAEFPTTGNREPLRVSVPVAELKKQPWHDIVCRCDGAKLEMFVDGRCVDEDFMLGDFVGGSGPLLFGVAGDPDEAKQGEILLDHVALWRRGLSNEEIVAACGGAEVVDRRKRTERGIAKEDMQYWKPPNEYNVGDCFPFYHDGTFHFAYLIDKEHHRAKNGLGAHQWAQATSRDLVHWEHQPLIVPITEQWEGSICTGSLYWHKGLYYAFYATRSAGADDLPMWHQYIAYATSRDGIHFEKQKPNPWFHLPEEYGADCRDPVVFHDETTGTFHMFITSMMKDRRACLAQMTSKDLKTWEPAEPIMTGDRPPECPSYFEWNGRYYLTYCLPMVEYLVSDKPAGPWHKPEENVICYGDAYVPKVTPYKDNRRLVVAWIPVSGWGGLSVWREAVALEDGALGSKWPPEMIPRTSEPVSLPAVKLDDEGRQRFEKLPRNYRLTLTVKDGGKDRFGVRLRQQGEEQIELVVDRAEKKLVLGHHSMPWTLPVEKLDVIVKDDVIDVCVNERQTIVTGRAGPLEGNNVELFREGAGVVEFASLVVRPLVAEREQGR